MQVLSLRVLLLGVASWLVPFIVAFFFVDRTGQFIIPQPLFKSIMVVVSGGCGTALLVIAFRKITPTMKSGFALGLFWLVINLILDLVILLPLNKMPVITYLYDIGLRYTLIPIISAALGTMAEKARVNPVINI